MSAPVKLRLSNVAKTFETGTQPVEALQPVDLEILEGEFVVLFGPSGCGEVHAVEYDCRFRIAVGR